MRFPAAITLAILSTFASVPKAAADVSVTFVNSFYYPDIQDKREAFMSELRKTLQDLGEHYFASGADLRVEVFSFTPMGLTVPKGATPPSQMELQYTLRQNGKLLLRDHEVISDINYLDRPIVAEAKGEGGEHGSAKKDPLAPQKAMLRDWFMQRFSAYTVQSAEPAP